MSLNRLLAAGRVSAQFAGLWIHDTDEKAIAT